MGLTQEEIDVLRFVSLGLPHGEIAKRMYYHRTTIGRRKRSAIEKLGAKNLNHAVTIAFRKGILI